MVAATASKLVLELEAAHGAWRRSRCGVHRASAPGETLRHLERGRLRRSARGARRTSGWSPWRSNGCASHAQVHALGRGPVLEREKHTGGSGVTPPSGTRPPRRSRFRRAFASDGRSRGPPSGSRGAFGSSQILGPRTSRRWFWRRASRVVVRFHWADALARLRGRPGAARRVVAVARASSRLPDGMGSPESCRWASGPTSRSGASRPSPSDRSATRRKSASSASGPSTTSPGRGSWSCATRGSFEEAPGVLTERVSSEPTALERDG